MNFRSRFKIVHWLKCIRGKLFGKQIIDYYRFGEDDPRNCAAHFCTFCGSQIFLNTSHYRCRYCYTLLDWNSRLPLHPDSISHTLSIIRKAYYEYRKQMQES